MRVILLLQGRMEYALLHYASRALYGALLDAGVKIYGYRKSVMHAKVAVIDQHWSMVGSSNIDPFSLLLARKPMSSSTIRSLPRNCAPACASIFKDGAMKVDQNSWHSQSLWRRIVNWSAYGFARLLLGLAGLGGKSY